MRRLIVTSLIVLVAGCGRRKEAPPAPSHAAHSVSADGSPDPALKQRADAGDANAAWSLFEDYAVYRYDGERAELWLRRAVALNHPEAQRYLAHLIKGGQLSHEGFGVTPEEAVQCLLIEASRSSADACFELAEEYSRGTFGAVDLKEARELYTRGASLGEHLCCRPLSTFLSEGRGGPIDRPGAYFWSAVDTCFIDPRSVAGEENWAFREQLASGLTLSDLETQWRRLDTYIEAVRTGAQQLSTAPFLNGMVDARLSREGHREYVLRERAYRARQRQKSRGAR